MTEQWIQGCVVQPIAFRDGLVLNLDDYNELDVFVPLTLTLTFAVTRRLPRRPVRSRGIYGDRAELRQRP